MRSVICIPNHHPNLDFLENWRILENETIIIVQDIGEKPIVPDGFTDVTIYDHTDIENDLGENAWIIPTRSSACRSYAYYKAWQLKPDYILTIDNDTAPEDPNWLKKHEGMLQGTTDSRWLKTAAIYTRGFPYDVRQAESIYINHGLWSNVPDLDAPTSLLNPTLRFDPCKESVVVPHGMYYPHCGMNYAWRVEATPFMYFGLQGPDYPFDRMDDIWAGIIAKKICDHLGYGVRSGLPSVNHQKQSNVFSNLVKEAPGIEVNEYFWRTIDEMELTASTPRGCYIEVAQQLQFDDRHTEYWQRLKQAMIIWANLFDETPVAH